MNLSEHFTKEEFIYSDTAKAKKINNEPTEIHLKTMKHTCVYFAEPMRKLFNDFYVGKMYGGKTVRSVAIKITSGYRSKKLNSAIPGSSKTSQHSTGEAFDFDAILVFNDKSKKTLNYEETYNLVKNWVKKGKLSVDQLICEKSGNACWVHASYKAGGASVNRKQFLKYNGKSYITDI